MSRKTVMFATMHTPKGLALTGLSLLVVGFGLSGCSTTKSYTVEVDAINDPTGVNGWSYVLAASAPARLSGDPQYAEVMNRIHVALSQRGMYEAPNPADADYVISFDYGERSPQTKVTTVSQPVMVQPGMGTMGGTGIGIGTGGVGIGTGGIGTGYPSTYPSTYPGGGYPGAGYPGTGSQVVMVPTTQVTRTSEKYLQISARENTAGSRQAGRPAREVWRVEAVLDDEEADVHRSIPALVDAVIEYMGTNTGGPVRVPVKLEG